MNLSAVRLALCTGLLGSLPFLAAAQQPAAPDPAQVQLDQVVQKLRHETLRFASEAQAVEDDLLYPPETRSSFYLGVKISHLLLESVSLQIDQRPPVSREFSESEARSLLVSGGLQRLMRANLDPGEHLVRVSLRGRLAGAKEGTPPFEAEYQSKVIKGLSPLEVKMTLSRKGRRNTPELETLLLQGDRS